MLLHLNDKSTNEDYQAVINAPQGTVVKIDMGSDYERILNKLSIMRTGTNFSYTPILAGTELYTTYGYGCLLVTTIIPVE